MSRYPGPAVASDGTNRQRLGAVQGPVPHRAHLPGQCRPDLSRLGRLGRALGQAHCRRRLAVCVHARARSQAPMLRAPDNLKFLRYGLRQIRRISKVVVRRTCFADAWNVGYASCSRQQVINGMSMVSPGPRPVPEPDISPTPWSSKSRQGPKSTPRSIAILAAGDWSACTGQGTFPGTAPVLSAIWPPRLLSVRLSSSGRALMVPESCALRKVILLKQEQSGVGSTYGSDRRCCSGGPDSAVP